jgi:hypothetical protein
MAGCIGDDNRNGASVSRPDQPTEVREYASGLPAFHAHAELRALSWRIFIHALEYSLTISPLYGSPPWSIFYRSIGN